MANEAHVRIDEGIKRGPRKVDRRPRAAKSGQFLPILSAEQKQIILQDTYQAIRKGETTDEIAARHNLSGRTLRYWLLDDPIAEEARRMLINGELARTLDEMKEAKHASSPLPLACAREEFRAWSWIAERREARLYGQKQEVSHTGSVPSLVIQVINAAPQQKEEKVIESVPESQPLLRNT